jgi:hypothetical protein
MKRSVSKSAVTRRAFLLSPAHCGGKRAGFLFRDGADFDLARRIRTRAGAPIGEVFSFVSGLYFRGKLAYAERFSPAREEAWVITPGDGLLPVDHRVTLEDLARYASVSVDEAEPLYRLPLVRDCEELAKRVSDDGNVVFLGSLATTKYLAILVPMFANRLLVPGEFIGRGDMSRGALMLAAVREERELDYLEAARGLPQRIGKPSSAARKARLSIEG